MVGKIEDFDSIFSGANLVFSGDPNDENGIKISKILKFRNVRNQRSVNSEF